MTTHTPGPWEIAGASHVYAPGPNGANICSISEPRASTIVGYTEPALGSTDSEEAYANAHLISAAPDMLAALKRAIARADANLPKFSHREPECQADYDACVAAIAKAEGRQ